MAAEVSDYRYGLEVKGEDQIYFRFMLWLRAHYLLSQFSSVGVNISHNDCLCCVQYKKGYDL